MSAGTLVSTYGPMVAALLAAGVAAGLVAGLFGVGGGTVVVPALFYAYATLRVGGEGNLHTAIGTSLLIIIATSIRSLSAHRRHGAVDEEALSAWTPWVALGAAAGAALAGAASKAVLGVVYAGAVLLVAAQMGLGREGWRLFTDLPTGWMRRVLGGVTGMLSAMMGVGGGALGGMLFSLSGRPIHQAVATASGFGLAIGAPAALAYVVTGLSAPGRPPLSIGYVNLPSALILGAMTTVVAPYGARLAHRMDRVALRRAFALFLTVTAAAVAAKALR